MDVNLAYYRKKDWRKFLEMIDDRDSIHDTWKEWHKSYLKVKRDLISQGFAVNDFVVDLWLLQFVLCQAFRSLCARHFGSNRANNYVLICANYFLAGVKTV